MGIYIHISFMIDLSGLIKYMYMNKSIIPGCVKNYNDNYTITPKEFEELIDMLFSESDEDFVLAKTIFQVQGIRMRGKFCEDLNRMQDKWIFMLSSNYKGLERWKRYQLIP